MKDESAVEAVQMVNCEHKETKRTPYEVVFKNRTPGLLDNPLTREIIQLNREKAEARGTATI